MRRDRIAAIVCALAVAATVAVTAACGDTSYSVADEGDSGADASTTIDAGASATNDASNDAKGATADASQLDAGVHDASSDDAGPCTADTVNDATNCGKCGRICNQGGCVMSECEHVVFVATPSNGANLGGIVGADKLCADTAAAAGLHGTFLAWLGTSTTSPATRYFKATRPYVMPLGTTVAANYTGLTSGGLMHGINAYADGGAATAGNVWTNVADNGTYAAGDGNACADWTSVAAGDRGNTGNVGGNGNGWTNSMSDACSTPGHGIYCFEQ